MWTESRDSVDSYKGMKGIERILGITPQEFRLIGLILVEFMVEGRFCNQLPQQWALVGHNIILLQMPYQGDHLVLGGYKFGTLRPVGAC
jgi:hypothetical protein